MPKGKGLCHQLVSQRAQAQHSSLASSLMFLMPSEENYGTVVMSEITNNPNLAFGAIGDFDENVFEVLDP